MRNLQLILFVFSIILFFSIVSCSGGGGTKMTITTTSPLPDAIETVDYPTTNTSPFIFTTADGENPINWTFDNFAPFTPAGLTFNSNGTISGAASKTMAGDYTFDVNAKDVNGRKAKSKFALKIWAKVSLDSPADLPVAMPGPANYNYTLITSGGAGSYSFKASSTIPSWLSLNATTGELAGIPPSTATGQKFTFDVTATCTTYSKNFHTKTFNLSISPAEIKNFKGPSEIFAQDTVEVTFDITNQGSSPFTITGADFTFTGGAGPSGNLNAEYNALAVLTNPSMVAGNSTESFIYKISVILTPTKATLTAPVIVDLEVNFTYASAPMKARPGNSISWACRVWELMSSLPAKRFWGAAASLGDHIYYFGGADDKTDVKYSIYDYDTTTNSWTTLSISLPAKSIWHSAVTASNRIYIIGGSDQIIGYKNVYEFNPSVPSLTKIGTLNRERYMSAVASNGSELYIFGSYQNGSIEIFNLNSKISTSKNAYANNYGRYLNEAVYYKNKYYSFGGSYVGQYDGHDTVYEYDPNTDTLTLKNSILHSITGHGLAQIGNYVYCIGGIASTTVGATNHFQRYDLDTFTAKNCGTYIDKVFGNSAAVVGNKIYTMGGISIDASTATNVVRMMEFN